MATRGAIACYNIKTGLGIVKDTECGEHFFEYSGVDAPLLIEGATVVLTRCKLLARDELRVVKRRPNKRLLRLKTDARGFA